MLALPARREETKPQVTAVLRESLENTSIFAKTRPRNDAKDFLGTLEQLGETENCREDVKIITPVCLGGGAQPAGWKGGTGTRRPLPAAALDSPALIQGLAASDER